MVTLIGHPDQSKTLCRRDQTRTLGISPEETLPHVAEVPLAQRALHHGADHQTHHFVEEPVAIEFNHGGRGCPLESNPADCSGRGGDRVASIRREPGKVVRAGKELDALAQGAIIESTGHMPGAPELERR